MKKSPVVKWLIPLSALVLWALLSYYLLAIISFSDFELDFSLQNQLRTALGMARQTHTSSLVQPMLCMLYGASGGIFVLVVLRFISLIKGTPSARWLTFTRIMQVVIGLAAAILLAMIGWGLSITYYDSVLTFLLSVLLLIRLFVFILPMLIVK